MTIREERNKYLITVTRASALKGYRRIRKFRNTLQEAEALEYEITEAVEKYGKWPVDVEVDKPLHVPASHYIHQTSTARAIGTTGTLREAAQLALDNHWEGQRYKDSVQSVVWALVAFMEGRGRPDLDDIQSQDIDALVAAQRDKQNAPSTINKWLGALRIINKVALKRIPPLATVTLPIDSVKGRRIEKWWLRPDKHIEVVNALRDPLNGNIITDPLFADLIDFIAYQGLRVEEALRLEERLLLDLDGKSPWLQPPGTKTTDAQNSIPIYPRAVAPLVSARDRARSHGWRYLFPLRPRQVSDRWNDVRDYLGVRDIPTSTMKSLRRTFAWYANSRGMPTSTLQKVLRHRNIATTAGYLELVGDSALRDSAEYFSEDSTQRQTDSPSRSNVGEIIKAYVATGATPEEVARFAKELMI